MLRRTKKQIIITAILVFILLFFGFLIYQDIEPGPSCFDGAQNQAEEGIDCGGPCDRFCLIQFKDIEVLWTEAIFAQEGFYDLGALIKNPNQNHGSGQIPYQFKLYDSDNKLIIQRSGVTFILPNQDKYIIEARVKSDIQIVKIDLSFGQVKWQEFKDYQPPQLIIKNQLIEKSPGLIRASGIVVNKSNFDFNKVKINVLLFDSNDQVVAMGATEINTLLSGQERYFPVSWYREIQGEIVGRRMEAETNVFDSDNFMERYGTSEEFKGY